jgi:hypothetical protein
LDSTNYNITLTRPVRCKSHRVGHLFQSLDDAQIFFRGCYKDCDPSVETLWAAHMNRDKRCIHVSSHQGDPTSVAFPFKSILRDALECQSAGILTPTNIDRKAQYL